MFSVARSILMCHKQSTSVHVNSLKNVLHNYRYEYSKFLAVCFINKKNCNAPDKGTTFRFYCTQSSSPTQETPSKPAKVVKIKGPIDKYGKPVDNVPRITEDMIIDAIKRPGGKVVTFDRKVTEKVKSVWYTMIIVVGAVVILSVFAVLIKELISVDSPHNIYTEAFKLCKQNVEVQDAVGMPMKCFGEETRRGYRRHVAHEQFIVNGVQHIRMKFYIRGAFRRGTVHLEKIANRKGYYDSYSYIIVDLDGYPPKRIVVDDGQFAKDDDINI